MCVGSSRRGGRQGVRGCPFLCIASRKFLGEKQLPPKAGAIVALGYSGGCHV